MADRSCAGLYVIVTLTHVFTRSCCLLVYLTERMRKRENAKSQHAPFLWRGLGRKANLIFVSRAIDARDFTHIFQLILLRPQKYMCWLSYSFSLIFFFFTLLCECFSEEESTEYPQPNRSYGVAEKILIARTEYPWFWGEAHFWERLLIYLVLERMTLTFFFPPFLRLFPVLSGGLLASSDHYHRHRFRGIIADHLGASNMWVILTG